MKKTICAVLEKNPKARVVLNAIALETLSQVLDLARETVDPGPGDGAGFLRPGPGRLGPII